MSHVKLKDKNKLKLNIIYLIMYNANKNTSDDITNIISQNDLI